MRSKHKKTTNDLFPSSANCADFDLAPPLEQSFAGQEKDYTLTRSS